MKNKSFPYSNFLRCTALLFLALGLSFTTQAQSWNEVIKIAASDRAANDQFGHSVSISGDYAIIGARLEDQDAIGGDTQSSSGALYILKRDVAGNWTQIKKIVASDRASGDQFGHSVSISGDYAIIGAIGEDEDATGGDTRSSAGSAYIFQKDQGGVDNWGQVTKIIASDRATSDQFGSSVSISGDYAIVGAYFEDEDAVGGNTLSTAGSAYIFQKDQGGVDNWGEVTKIVAPNRAELDQFGYSVSISGNYAIVGAIGEDEDATEGGTQSSAGSAYIFQKDQGGVDNWGQVTKIIASDRSMNDQFGYSVSISGDYAIVGAWQEDQDATGGNNRTNSGSAYIFQKDEGGVNNWGQVTKIVASDRAGRDQFGSSVSISGNRAIVGAQFEDQDTAGGNTQSGAGSAYIFQKDEGGTNNWGEVTKIVASDRDEEDRFGRSVSISGDYAIVGAYLEDEDAAGGNDRRDAGSVYLFETLQPAPEVTLNTTPTDFGDVTLGESTTLTYEIENTGSATLTVNSITSDQGEFAISGITTPLEISVGTTATFEVVFSPSVTGTASATITINSDASNSSTVVFSVSGRGVASASITASDLEICAGESVTLTTNSGDNYLWDNGETTQEIVVSPLTITTYSVTVTTGMIESATQVTIVVNELPNVTISGSNTVCAGEQTAIMAGGASTYLWSNGSTSTTINVEAGEYSVTGTDANGCLATSATFTIISKNVLPELSLSLNQMTINEDDGNITLIFTFTRADVGCLADLMVNFSVSGTAIYNNDYYLVRGADTFTATSGTVTIPAGQSSAQVVLQAQQDAISESDETIILTIENP